ncbi:glycerate kinase family protein [Liquorilactobacillus sicerae]|uniref:glycerate kinase family protein n=1 Tax=Liquorilactobacillus sicerae TaxID=1416943 RepID=UPI002480A323|nr:glycerate kinase [Liquorilactobacillus sicerae]
MKFLIAPDSFKGSLTAKEVAESIYQGLIKVFPTADYQLVPMADGGEGTVQSLIDATHGTKIHCQVHGPLKQGVDAYYGILGDSQTAVIEMAQASGIQYVTDQTHNPLITTTFGTGELILDALNHHVKRIILGIGGSATNDGGAGMAQALGARLLTKNGQPILLGGGNLNQLDHLDISQVDSRIAKTEILIASDVTNPLTGKNGASAVFGPQKGATATMVKQLDANLHHYATIIKRDLGKDLEMLPGAGAAGGLGAGLLAFTNSTMKKGIELVIEYSGLAQKAAGTQFCFTGEGKIDFQTKFGKTPFGVAQTVKKINPAAVVIGIAGGIGNNLSDLYDNQIFDAIFSSPAGAKNLQRAFADSKHDIQQTAENIARLIKTVKQH